MTEALKDLLDFLSNCSENAHACWSPSLSDVFLGLGSSIEEFPYRILENNLGINLSYTPSLISLVKRQIEETESLEHRNNLVKALLLFAPENDTLWSQLTIDASIKSFLRCVVELHPKSASAWSFRRCLNLDFDEEMSLIKKVMYTHKQAYEVLVHFKCMVDVEVQKYLSAEISLERFQMIIEEVFDQILSFLKMEPKWSGPPEILTSWSNRLIEQLELQELLIKKWRDLIMNMKQIFGEEALDVSYLGETLEERGGEKLLNLLNEK